VKLVQRDIVPIALGERDGERETGIASFIIMGGTFAMHVRG
jgi:hypothetical protein